MTEDEPPTEPSGEPPTHDLIISRKDNPKAKTRAGVAWNNEQGWLQIRLNPGIVLDWRDELYISLYPKRDKKHE